MGYSDADVRVYVDVSEPQYLAFTYLQCGIHRLRACPSIQLGPPIRPVCYTLGMPQCTTRPPRVRELVGVFGCCCVNWCATSLVRGSVRVALAVQRLAQHATLLSTAQHPCALQHNATTGITYTQHCAGSTWGTTWLEQLWCNSDQQQKLRCN